MNKPLLFIRIYTVNDEINIEILEQSLNLIKQVYLLTDKETFTDNVLKEALRKSVISVNSNISEAAERSSLNEIRHFLKSANGALSKLKSHAAAAEVTGFMKNVQFKSLLENITKLSMTLHDLVKQ